MFFPRKDESATTRYIILSSLSEAGFCDVESVLSFIDESFSRVASYETYSLDLMLYNVVAACTYACPLEAWAKQFMEAFIKIEDYEIYMHRILVQAKRKFHGSIIVLLKEAYSSCKAGTSKSSGSAMKIEPVKTDS